MSPGTYLGLSLVLDIHPVWPACRPTPRLGAHGPATRAVSPPRAVRGARRAAALVPGPSSRDRPEDRGAPERPAKATGNAARRSAPRSPLRGLLLLTRRARPRPRGSRAPAGRRALGGR